MTSSAAAQQHMLDLDALEGQLSRDIQSVWQEVVHDPTSVRELAPLIDQYASAASALGSDYYEVAREEAGAKSRFTTSLTELPPAEQTQSALGFATQDLRQPDGNPDTALTNTEGVAQRLVANADRKTLVEAVQDDKDAVGWVREARGPEPCSFCRLMLIRGVAYKNRFQAGSVANKRFVGEGEFKFHNHDKCTARPVFADAPYEMPPEVRKWDEQYRQATKKVSGAEKRRAFRRAVEADQRSTEVQGDSA